MPGVHRIIFVILATCIAAGTRGLPAQETENKNKPDRWTYSAEQLKPFWKADVIHDEPVLFVKDPNTGAAIADLLFPVKEVLSVRNSTGDINYKADVDYQVKPGASQIVVPSNSGIVTYLPKQLRRPAGSQKYNLTHRDGNGEILFGATLEYHGMQTLVTYVPAKVEWNVAIPTFDPSALPRTIDRLRSKQSTSIVLLGDSISTGCNASGWADGAPYQPAYPDLLRQHLAAVYETNVKLQNLSVGGTSTPWGLTKVDDVVQHNPHLVILAFGMNDSAGISPQDYGSNIAGIISAIRATQPETEFILVASMLGNRDWTRLNHDAFPQFRDELKKLSKPGIALADLTSVWQEFLKRKQDRDLTGNGVNHPNDFGHRVYAQVLSALLVPSD